SLVVLDTIHRWQNIFLSHYETRLIYASDEWYITAELPIPEEDAYEGYPQLENGVGLIRSLQNEFNEYYDELAGDNRSKTISLATGILAAPYLKQMVTKLTKKFPEIKIEVYTIINHYFGNDITVAGLITGGDIISQLTEQPLGEYLLLPDVLLRNGETVLLDDITVSDMENALQTKIHIVQSDGKSFIDSIIM
ncbi:MAG: DUF512 domain-containing protein, partial [Mobilitalea sp.]